MREANAAALSVLKRKQWTMSWQEPAEGGPTVDAKNRGGNPDQHDVRMPHVKPVSPIGKTKGSL